MVFELLLLFDYDADEPLALMFFIRSFANNDQYRKILFGNGPSVFVKKGLISNDFLLIETFQTSFNFRRLKLVFVQIRSQRLLSNWLYNLWKSTIRKEKNGTHVYFMKEISSESLSQLFFLLQYQIEYIIADYYTINCNYISIFLLMDFDYWSFSLQTGNLVFL